MYKLLTTDMLHDAHLQTVLHAMIVAGYAHGLYDLLNRVTHVDIQPVGYELLISLMPNVEEWY